MILDALLVLAILGLAGAAGLEAVARLAGLGGFPLFARDPASVYRMAANQQGRFRRRARWRYDRFGLRTDDDAPDLAGRVVLLGDSVVEGGLYFDQGETVAAQIAAATGWPISPVGCHGWALTNALGAMTALPDWDRAAALVWVVNTGDFDTVGEGESELSFPTRRPWWLTLWLFRRHVYRAAPWWWPWGAKSPRASEDLRPDLRAAALHRFAEIATRIEGPILIVAHAKRGQDISGESFFRALADVRPGIGWLAPCDFAEWGRNCYADDIHPNAHGAVILARLIAAHPCLRKEP